jgi:hypothetical protein
MNPEEIILKYSLEEMLNILPGTIIHRKRKWFLSNEIYDLNISKDPFNNWIIEYFNERMLESYFRTTHQTLKRALSEMLSLLSSEMFITL